MENEPLLDDLPIKHANYLLAMLNYWGSWSWMDGEPQAILDHRLGVFKY